MDVLTRLEEIFLLAVWRLGDNAYGVTIADKLTDTTNKKWIMSQVYVPLERLENKGYLKSYLSAPISERGGRSKRLYGLTEKGLQALIEINSMQKSLWSDVSPAALRKDLKNKLT